MNEVIDFSKPFVVEHSRNGEQNVEGLLIYHHYTGERHGYVDIVASDPLGHNQRIPLSISQARTVGEHLINYANLREADEFTAKNLSYQVPRDQYKLDPLVYRIENGVATSMEIEVSIDPTGIVLKQDTTEGEYDIQEVTISNQQLESFIRQGVKLSPKFRKMLNDILENTI